MSIDQLDQRSTSLNNSSDSNTWYNESSITNTNTNSNPNNNSSSNITINSDVEDEREVFTEEAGWNNTTKSVIVESGLSISGPAINDVCDVSSSPTSSVSSSKVELTTYFDNDSGIVGGSNALDSTPISLHCESQTSYQDQPYLDAALDSQTWYQQRGAYSAPSSPALPRNVENLSSRGSSPGSSFIRSHPSMDGINSNHKPWPKKFSSTEPDCQPWNSSSFRNLISMQNGKSPEHHDSGLSSPQNNPSDRRTKSERQLKLIESDIKTQLSHPSQSFQPPTQTTATNHVTKQWTVERFQDVRNLSDLLKHLSLEKYTSKLEVCHYETIVTFYKIMIYSKLDV